MNSEDETLLEFPCRFPIKAMGRSISGLEEAVIENIRKFAPEVTHDDVKVASSRSNRYVSVTVTITATSRAQLDDIYQCLTRHPDIMMAF